MPKKNKPKKGRSKKKGKKKQQTLDVENAEITEEMEKAYIDYAMSVIVSRALPSVEDGLKPVHRRILYAMKELGLDPNKPTKKSARIVGDTLGKLHPHGDQAVYNSLVRMAQPFSLRYPLIDGQGNFGSLDGDPPAAMRYSEARLDKISLELLEDLDKETVEMTPNFDNSMEEPTLLPAKLPNLLINGASGIAVGMATNIPPYNLTEVCDGIVEYINNPDISIKKLTKTIKGPDFPTGGKIAGEVEKIHKKGKGRIWMRGKVEKEEVKRRERLVVKEIPYLVNKSDLVSQIADLVKSKQLPNIKDVRDESAKGEVRVVIELKQGSNPKFTENRLYKKTRLQSRFDANLIALVKGKPKRLSLKDIIQEYVRHRKGVIKRRSKFELNKAEERVEVVKGLLKALKDIDNIIKVIKKSKNTKRARKNLTKKFSLSKKQANAILKMRLSSLTSLQQEKLKKEKKDLNKKIKRLKKILGSKKEILKIIKKDLEYLKKKYGDKRKSEVAKSFKEIKKKDLVQKKDVAISITEKGYIKRQDFKYYKEQKRGGRGVTGSKLATGDFVKEVITCSTHDYLLLFTNQGRVYWLKAYKVPKVKRKGKGKPIVNLVSLNKNEEVASILNVSKFENSIIMATQKGQVKKLKLDDLGKPRKSGKRVMKLPKDDRLLEIKYLSGDKEIMLITRRGQAIRFNSKGVRAMGGSAYGVIGIKLEDDKVVGVEIPDKDDTLLTVTKNGYGKRSKIDNYRLTNRAGKGVINMNVTKDGKIRKKTGPVMAACLVKDEDSIIVSTAKGMTIRMAAKDIRVMGRNTRGVKVVNLKDKDRVIDVVKVPEAD